VSLINELIKSAKLAKQGKKVIVNPKPFFSAVDKAALDLQRAKGTGKEFMTELKKTKGVKPTEIENRKLAQIEEMPKMTKDQFIDELEKRPPADLKERTLIEESEKNKEFLAGEQYGVSFDDLRADEEKAVLSQLVKYGDYKLPGGENYREILLQLPTFGGKDLEDLMYLEAMERRGGIGTKYGEDRLAMLRKKRDEMGQPYMTPHFEDEPNTLAHMRVQDRVGPNGEKILHVEEIQSDWHQKGREIRNQKIKELMKAQSISKKEAEKLVSENYGYEAVDAKTKPKLALDEYEKDAKERLRQLMLQQAEPEMTGEKALKFVNNYVSTMDGSAVSNMLNEKTEWNRLYRAYHEAERGEGVPDAPFKKNWHELAMKRLLNYASENGYDGVAITPGKLQIDRYEEALRKNLDNLEYESYQNPDTGKTVYELSGSKNGQQVFSKEDLTPEEVKDLVGKDMFAKIEAGQGKSLSEERPLRPAWMRLEGDDISIGGEGMKGFYDKMIPDYLNTFGKKYNVQTELGGYKLKGDPSLRGDASERLGLAGQSFADMTPEEIAAFNAKLDESNAKQLHYFKITPEMREEVKQGMPLYQQVGVPIGTGAAGAELAAPPEEEPAFAAGGAVFNTTPDMSDGGQILQGPPFKRGGKVHVAHNPDAMFMELNDKKFKRK
jgi:hypothetical protein